MAVKYVKLLYGDDFVADVEDGSKKGMLKITKPVRFMLSPDGVAAMPYLPFCKNNSHEIDAKLVLIMDDVETELHNAYQEKFGNGILLATSSLKLSD